MPEKHQFFVVVRQGVKQFLKFLFDILVENRGDVKKLSVYWIQITDHGGSDDPHDRIWHKHRNDYLLDI